MLQVKPVPYEEPSADHPRSSKVARLVDVAREAGVSVSTAGRVLRNSDLPVAAAVATQVREVARQLGYVPNVLARSLRGSRPQTVGLVVGDMLDPYYATVAEVVTERAEAEHGLLAVVCNIQHDPRLELKYCQQLWEHRVAGLILSGGGFDQQMCAKELAVLVKGMRASGLMVCTLGPRLVEAPMFCVDNEAAGRMAAAQALAAGHRCIGVVNGNARSQTGLLRLAGSMAALREAGVEPYLCDVDYRLEAVAAGLHDMLLERPDITCLLATSDFMSTSAVEWLVTRGISVPEGMSVVGIRGVDSLIAGRRLTSVDVQIAACSRAALDHIASHSPDMSASPDLRPPLLRKGETLAPPR